MFCAGSYSLFWVTGGTWRSATRRGGFWARMAKIALVLGWLGVLEQTVQEFLPKHRSTHADANTVLKPNPGLKPSHKATDVLERGPSNRTR
jgi:hypothetical protein